MLVSILCILKWLLSALALPAAVIAAIGLLSWSMDYTHQYLRDRADMIRQQLSPEQRDAKYERERKINRVVNAASGVFTVVVIGFAVLVVCAISAMFVMPMWGCDKCLPEFMPTQCKVSDAIRIQDADAATVRALCDKWGWTPPDMSDTPADSQPEVR